MNNSVKPTNKLERARFVVQHHLARRDHFDLRLEWKGVLLSWAVPKGPSFDPNDKRLAIHVEDHPIEYRHFEGTIPQGQYGGGTVMLWDEGFWEPLNAVGEVMKNEANSKSTYGGSLKFLLYGKRLKGKWVLVKTKNSKNKTDRQNYDENETSVESKGHDWWLLIKENDEFSQTESGIAHFNTSIRTGRSMQEIESGKAVKSKNKTQSVESASPENKNNNKNTNANKQNQTKQNALEIIKITNPGKLLFTEPEITKLEIAEYYQAISARMLPYVENRILSLVVCPQGIATPCFYKKHPVPQSQNVFTIPIQNSEGEKGTFQYINDAVGLVAEVQNNSIEFHTWGSTVHALEKPDIMVFDLDPDEGMDLSIVRQGVKDLKSVLNQLNLVSYLKTSGNKGYHIVVPFMPAVSWDIFNTFAKKIAQYMEQKWPDRYTSNIRKVNRKGKIFIDWIRNGKGATSIAPYSIRAKKGARISMPIAWRELNKIAPNDITMEQALKRAKGTDPWADFFKTQKSQQLK